MVGITNNSWTLSLFRYLIHIQYTGGLVHTYMHI